MHIKFFLLSLLIVLASDEVCWPDLKMISVKVDNAPIVDGTENDHEWIKAKELIVYDKIASLDISIKSVFTDKKLYFLVRFYDSDQSRLHKPWIWNPTQKMYDQGPEREDCLVFKWAMDAGFADLSLTSEKPYTADIWFWKANRTDPVGFADDKNQVLSFERTNKSKKLVSKAGHPMYLRRKGDQGKSAYKSELYVEYKGDRIPQFINQHPTNSRADVRAKGIWSNSEWIVEFSRSLKTDHRDDVQFDIHQDYIFGVSRFEIAGRKPNSRLSQPLYGSGDISERLILVFEN